MQKVDTYHEGVHTIDPATRGVLSIELQHFHLYNESRTARVN
jgi:hypothetical protein